MTKSKIHKKRIIAFLVVLTLVVLGTFNLSSIYAIKWEGDGATFDPDDEYPTQYGAFIPQPNMAATMSVDASNQGNFTMMDWLGGVIDSEVVDYQGADISHLYPWDFDNYVKLTTTSDDYIDPWDIDWINVTAYNPHNVNLSSYTLNSVFDYHTMIEGNTLNVPVHSGFPMQIDVMLESTGPKILKFDWLSDSNPIYPLDFLFLVSPSGKLISLDDGEVQHGGIVYAWWDSDVLFWYMTFIAQETGTYRLLLEATHSEPLSLSLEFLNTQEANLPLNNLRFGGNTDGVPNLQELWEIEWQNNWFKFNGEKGDVFRLDIGIDYGDSLPEVSIWYPCENGYIHEDLTPSAGIFDVILPATGSVYISFIDETYSEWYRYSLYLDKFDVIDYHIGDNLTTVKVNRDQRKAIEFEIEEDSFVVFNYTLFTQPFGDPIIYADSTDFGFYYEDSNKLECYGIIPALNTKIAGDNETFYYYYLPAGTYKTLVANNDVQYDGVVQISSKYVDFTNATIPINHLTYPDIDPSQFLTLNFDPDEYYNGIYEAQYVYINITEPGQYFLNATIYASDHLDGLPLSADPAAVVVYNSSEETFHDWTEEALNTSESFPAFSDDNTEQEDMLFIAYPKKWHDMEFNFTSFGNPNGVDITYWVWSGSSWDPIAEIDGTSEFTNNGSVVLDITSEEYSDWTLGSNFDLPELNEGDYYWVRAYLENGFYTSNNIPYIQILKLSNVTLEGDINLALVGDSGYEHSDYWTPYIEPSLDLLINQESENLNDSTETWLFENSAPRIIGLEVGLYKLQIIPHGWGYQGPLQIDFAIGNWWSYRHELFYNITEEPNVYSYQINNYTTNWYGPDNITTYSYGLTASYNHTEVSSIGGNSYFVLECAGDAYKWTQLVVSTNNVSDYNLYIMQNLSWISNIGPNDEVKPIPFISLNNTYEFGVLSDTFYLIFEVDALEELVKFRIDLTQYNTTILTSSIPIASYSPPFESGPLILGLVIGIPVAAGIIVVVYILKKKGRILTKHPG